MAKKIKGLQQKMERMRENPPPKSGLIRAPRGEKNGPVVRVDIDRYLAEKSDPTLTKASSMAASQAHDPAPRPADETLRPGSGDGVVRQTTYLNRNAIQRQLNTGNLSVLEDLWLHRVERICYREDAAAVLAKLRVLRGIDTYEKPYAELADVESLQRFKVINEDDVEPGPAVPPVPVLKKTHRVPVEPAETLVEAPVGDKRVREIAMTVRDGQSRFRNNLIRHYGAVCMVTGELLDAVIEAAHILPYDGAKTNRLSNGLLLRVDIHRLFDKGLLRIHPETLAVVLHLDLESTSYRTLAGKPLELDGLDVIDRMALKTRWTIEI